MMTIFVEPTGPASGSATTGTGDITTDLTAPIVTGPESSGVSFLFVRIRKVLEKGGVGGCSWMTPAFYSDRNPANSLVM